MKSYYYLIFFFSSLSLAQVQPAVDFTQLQAKLQIAPEKKALGGEVHYTFDILETVDSIFLDARNMKVTDVRLNGQEVDFVNTSSKIILISDFQTSRNNVLSLHYRAQPDQAMYFVHTSKPPHSKIQVWTQGQGKYTSNWLPSIDEVSEKMEFDLSVDYPSGYTLISNGELDAIQKIDSSVTRWIYDMDKPMSSYLAAIAAGKYQQDSVISESGVPMIFYYPEGMEAYLEPTYRHSRFLMDFMESEIEVKYPWKNYKQVPVQDFLYAGMENTGTTIFSDFLMVDSIGYTDRNYVNVNAHELAHQWFGNLVTAKTGKHHWLQEGFATYYALLAEREIFGDDYFYWKLFQSAEELKELSDSGEGESLLNPKASSLTFYQKGAWALHILTEKVGKNAFDEAVRQYLVEHSYGTVTTEDFVEQVEEVSGVDLSQFKEDWLTQTAFQGTAALESLKKSAFIQDYLALAALREIPIEEKRDKLEKALEFPVNDYLGQEVVFQLALEDPQLVVDLYRKAFDTGNIYVRQAISSNLREVPETLKVLYEGLLDDPSYVTKENALYHLWSSFPQDRENYLLKTEGVQGFTEKNIRTLWLALSLATPQFREMQKKAYLEELISYTAPFEPYQLRQNAFGLLYQLGAFNAKSMSNLKAATDHHNYRFRSFAKELLNQLTETTEN